MEKPAKSMSRLLSFLPKATAVTFQNPPLSPGRDKRSDNSSKFKLNNGKAFSGPIISIIPVEARTKSNSGRFDAQEPTSPKVSCIGQIKLKKKKKKIPRSKSKRVAPPPPQGSSSTSSSPPEVKKKPSSAIRNIFRGVRTGKKAIVSVMKPPVADKTPSLSQMKRFSSGRNAFANFDWRDHVLSNHPDKQKDESDEEDEIIISHSAPILVGGGDVALEPKKEINLWKRRTVAPPTPLQLNSMGKPT
ncbi:PREDICTED: uncharacterized protein At1g76070-like [Nelumbo nucifera]|uniref:Uncharacterized protein At1g76070-like n=2 Tax=Nelumbo nucifera TaxID=4432 RepID=A0A1U8AT80_NELNU|nr:PREDICTED: uncharacterized protein At1g76070-like [Nelumbo nucifera]DAD41721.1 TPA_asm: hypothetical protein HUJ06_016044 [Nelumbo nucifera]